MSRWRALARSVPKRGEPDAHNKDRAAISRGRRGRLLAAVADGATQGYHDEAWAEALVSAWVASGVPARGTNAALGAAIARLSSHRAPASPPAGDAPWYVAAKAARGAYATLLALEVRPDHRRWRWQALAVGDTDLFVLDARRELVAAFPVESSSAFGATPALIGTRAPAHDLGPGRRLRRRGILPPGGALLVATDALAKCLLEASASGAPLWGEASASLRSQRAFACWVESLRNGGGLGDDDTTLLVVERVR